MNAQLPTFVTLSGIEISQSATSGCLIPNVAEMVAERETGQACTAKKRIATDSRDFVAYRDAGQTG